MKRNLKGFTLAELIVYIMIFGLFMLGVYATLEAGMKTWRIGEVKADIYQKAQLAMGYIVRDFSYSNWASAQLDPNDPNSGYVCFETPFDNSNFSVIVDCNRGGALVWQGYLLYYSATSGTSKNLYRYYTPRVAPNTPNSIPILFASTVTYVGKTSSLPGDSLRTISQGIEDIKFIQDQNKLIISISFKKNVRQGSGVIFNQQGNKADAGTENFTLKASVVPKN